MSVFIVFPDNSKAGKVRFFDALVRYGASIRRTPKGRHDTPHFLVEAPSREDFAATCGPPGRPVPTEDAGVARPA